jgi:hypothetical protein
MTRTLALLPILLLAVPVPAAAPVDSRLAAPEVRVEGYRFVVERFMQQQNLTEEFAADQPPEKKGRQHLYLGLAVYPPDPKLLANVQGLDPRVIAFAGPGGKVITLRSYPADDGPLLDGVWRTQLAAQDLDLTVSTLNRLQGELVVFPHARRVTLDFPLPVSQAVTKEAEGLKVTVKNMRARTGGLAATVEMEWPASQNVAILNPEAPGGITLHTAAGTPLIPNGAGTSGTTRGGKVLRTQNISLSELKEKPVKLRLEVLVRNGTPRKIPFSFASIPLPDTLGLEPAAIAADADFSVRSHPFVAQGGGILTATVRGASSLEGRLLLGISRFEAGTFGAVRWLELAPDREGKVSLAGVRPGRYRVTVAWSPEAAAPGGGLIRELPSTARVLAPPATVQIAAGKTLALQPLNLETRQ